MNATMTEPSLQPVTADSAPQPTAEESRATLENRMRSGASWFIWIAALSVINSIIALSGSTWGFIIGLGVTQVIDALANIARQSGASVSIFALGLDMLAAGVFMAFELYARKGRAWVFVVGMMFYLLDGGIFLLVSDWVGVGFHAFALFCIYRGYKACRELTALDREATLRVAAAGAAVGAPI